MNDLINTMANIAYAHLQEKFVALDGAIERDASLGKFRDAYEGCGCIEVSERSEIDGRRWATAGEAQRGHEAFVRKYAKLLAERGKQP